MADRLEEALVRRKADVIVEADEMRGRADLPVERAHPDGEHPRKDDHRANDDDRRDDEAAIVATSPREERRRRTRRDAGRYVDSGASVPKGDWGGARRHGSLPTLD